MLETHNYEVAAGVNYEYVFIRARDASKPTLLFLHGFPSSFYCWRYQIEHFSKQGYGCLAPNLMGYGKTYSPLDIHAFKTKTMVEHLILLLDHLKLDKVVALGHDWGVRPATRFVLYHPERTLGLVLFNVGYSKPAPMNLEHILQLTKQIFGYELLGYWEFFCADDAAAIIESNPDGFIDIAFASDPAMWKSDLAPLGKIRAWMTGGKTTARAAFLTDEDAQVLKRCIAEGMQPKLNWYRSAVANVDGADEKDLDPALKPPVLYVAGTKDYICVPAMFAEQKALIAELETAELETSHWTMEEKPEEVNEILEKWLQRFV